MTLPTARDFHNGAFKAQVAPQNNTIAFADDGSNYGEGCQVRFTRALSPQEPSRPMTALADCRGGSGFRMPVPNSGNLRNWHFSDVSG
jgi:hypothetical protein